jgi:hypothetical protein
MLSTLWKYTTILDFIVYQMGGRLFAPFASKVFQEKIESRLANKYGVEESDWFSWYQNHIDQYYPKCITEEDTILIKRTISNFSANQNEALVRLALHRSTSRTMKIFNNLLESVQKVIHSARKANDLDEDQYLKRFIDPLVWDPFFERTMEQVKAYGNTHSIHESRFRKIGQAKKNGHTKIKIAKPHLDISTKLPHNKCTFGQNV